MDGMKTAKRGRFDSLRMLLVTVLIVGGLLAVKPIDSTIVRSIPLLKNLHLEQGIIPEVNAYYNKLYNVSDAVDAGIDLGAGIYCKEKQLAVALSNRHGWPRL